LIADCALRFPNLAVTVAVPEFRAVSVGGSSVESESTAVLSIIHAAPVTGFPFWSDSARVRVLPTNMAAVDGVRDKLAMTLGVVTVMVAEARTVGTLLPPPPPSSVINPIEKVEA